MAIINVTGSFGPPTGAIIGFLALKSHGPLGMALGAAVGGVLGLIVAVLYGLVIISCISAFHWAWCSYKKQPEVLLSGPVWKTMKRIGALGAMVGINGVLFGWLTFGWRESVLVAIVVALATGAVAGLRSGAA